MPKKTFKETFVEALTALAGGEEKAINNTTLRNSIGWEAARYQKVRDALIFDGILYSTVGGPGGAVCLTAPVKDLKPEAVRIFISYSHKDEEIKDELLKHLSPMRRLGKIADWHDRNIEAGEKWEDSILKSLNSADIILLIISIDFINSDYCYVKEMDAAIDREAEKKAIIIPVIARSCMWKGTKFGGYQALPTNGKAIQTWNTIDEPLSIVAEGVQLAVDRILNDRK